MKRISSIIIGLSFMCFGAIALLLSTDQTFAGNYIWIPVMIASGALILAGARIARGEKLKDIVHDLLFVLIRTP